MTQQRGGEGWKVPWECEVEVPVNAIMRLCFSFR